MTYSPYLGDPPFQRSSATSEAAAASMVDHAPSQRDQVHAVFLEAGDYGCTRDEICVALDLDVSSVNPRLLELEARHLIRRTNRKRKTRKGRLAEVYVAVVEVVEPKQVALFEMPAAKRYH